MEDRINQLLTAHIESSIALADQLPAQIVEAGTLLAQSLLSEGKLLLCAHGRAYANGVHFVTSMLNRYEVERPPLPVMMLGTHVSILHALISEGHDDQVFAREVQALGSPADLLFILSTSGSASSLVQAVHAAKEKGMDCIVVCGEDGGMLAHHLGPSDISIRVPSSVPSRIVELQLVVLHGCCEVIDSVLFSQVE
jgi:D-sedoheptulose 7-phosphate isomerase